MLPQLHALWNDRRDKEPNEYRSNCEPLWDCWPSWDRPNRNVLKYCQQNHIFRAVDLASNLPSDDESSHLNILIGFRDGGECMIVLWDMSIPKARGNKIQRLITNFEREQNRGIEIDSRV